MPPLTLDEESVGLYAETPTIGFKLNFNVISLRLGRGAIRPAAA